MVGGAAVAGAQVVNAFGLTGSSIGINEWLSNKSGSLTEGGTPSGFYQDANGRWHRPNGQFASNVEVSITLPSKVSAGGNGNSLSNPGTNHGYALVDRETNEILKFGETTHPTTRYSQRYLDANNANMMIYIGCVENYQTLSKRKNIVM